MSEVVGTIRDVWQVVVAVCGVFVAIVVAYTKNKLAVDGHEKRLTALEDSHSHCRRHVTQELEVLRTTVNERTRALDEKMDLAIRLIKNGGRE